MRTALALLAGAALAALPACDAAPGALAVDAAPDATLDARPALAAALAAEGFTVQAGDAFGFGLADCADLPDCFASNASGSYLLFSVPPTPGGALPPLGASPPTCSSAPTAPAARRCSPA